MAQSTGKLIEKFPLAAHRGTWPLWTFEGASLSSSLPRAHSHPLVPFALPWTCLPCLVIFFVFLAPRLCKSWQSFTLPSITPCVCFLELSKSQNDVTSEKHLLAMDPRQCVVPTERRSQSDTAVNVTSRVSTEAWGPLHLHVIFSGLSGLFSSAFTVLLIENLNHPGKPKCI